MCVSLIFLLWLCFCILVPHYLHIVNCSTWRLLLKFTHNLIYLDLCSPLRDNVSCEPQKLFEEQTNLIKSFDYLTSYQHCSYYSVVVVYNLVEHLKIPLNGHNSGLFIFKLIIQVCSTLEIFPGLLAASFVCGGWFYLLMSYLTSWTHSSTTQISRIPHTKDPASLLHLAGHTHTHRRASIMQHFNMAAPA